MASRAVKMVRRRRGRTSPAGGGVARCVLKKGDTVIVMAGRDKGKRGDVLRVLREESRVLVQGVGVVKRHTRPSVKSQGGIEEKEQPVHISNVAVADPKSGKPTRVGYRFLEDGRKLRYAKASGELLD